MGEVMVLSGDLTRHSGEGTLASTKLWEGEAWLSEGGGCFGFSSAVSPLPLLWLSQLPPDCPDSSLQPEFYFSSFLLWGTAHCPSFFPVLSFLYIFLSVSVSFSVQSKWPFSVDTLLQGAGWAPSCLQPLSFHFASDSAFIPMHFKPCQ